MYYGCPCPAITSVLSNSLSLNKQRFTPSGYKVLIKFEFVVKTKFLSKLFCFTQKLIIKLNHHTLLFCILCLKINTITITIYRSKMFLKYGIKDTFSVISRDSPCKYDNVRFTTVPFKPLSDQQC